MRQKNLEFLEFEVELPRVSAKSLRRVVFHCPLATVNRLLFTRVPESLPHFTLFHLFPTGHALGVCARRG